MVTQYKNLIGGKMVTTDRMLDVVNPATEQVIGQVPACGKAELDQAVAAAREAMSLNVHTVIYEELVSDPEAALRATNAKFSRRFGFSVKPQTRKYFFCHIFSNYFLQK